MNPVKFKLNGLAGFIIFFLLLFANDEAWFSSAVAAQSDGAPEKASGGDQISHIGTGLLSDEERDWLKNHPVIRVAQDPGWPPIEFADQEGKPTGISNDYLKIIEHNLGVKFAMIKNLTWQEAYSRMKRWDIDMTTSVTVTPERNKFWVFTKPYMTIPIVILTHSDVTYVGDMRQLEGKKVAVVDGYAICDMIPKQYPGIELVKVKTTREGIDILQAKDVFAFIDNMLVIGYYLAQMKIINLKIAGETPYSNAQSMAVRKDWAPLAGILQKVLDSIDDKQERDIYNKWVPIQYDHGFNYRQLWQIIAVFMLILAVLAIWNRRLSREVKLRKKTEASLRVSEQRFRQLFNIAPIPICIIDKNGKMRDLNKRFVHAFGYNRDDVPDLETWWRNAYPDPGYRDLMREDWERCILHSGETSVDIKPVESRLVRKDGEILTVITFGTVLEDVILYLFHDITERKQAEEALRESEEKFFLIFKRAPLISIISVFDDGKLLDVNDKFLEITGFALEEVLGRTTIELGWLKAEDRARVVMAMQNHGKITGMEITCHNKAGEPINCLVHCELVSIGNVKRLLTLALDITEHKNAERDKVKLEAQLHQAQKMEAIGTLAGGIAHDFNNILGTIIGFGEIALDSAKSSQDNVRDIQEILKAGERAKDLVRQILTFSRKVEVEMKPLDINKEVKRTVDLLSRTLPKMIGIEARLEPGLRPVRANANQMEQILLNLANNAHDAMPEGGRLSIETESVTLDQDYSTRHLEMKAGRYALIRVSDTGQGIDEKTREHIFEPFFTTKEVGRGTGLGLSTVYGIVKSHGGHISCYSEPGMGISFKIYLPIAGEEEAAPIIGNAPPDSWSQGSGKILLVDDEEPLRTLGARALAVAGYEVETAASGEEALEIFQREGSDLDLIIMDLGMPGMGGHRALKAILETRPGFKVIIASGYSANGQVKDSLESGAAGYVAKPFRRADLLATVRDVLDG